MPPRRNPKRKAQTASASKSRDGYIALPHNMGYIPIAKPAENQSGAGTTSDTQTLPTIVKPIATDRISPPEASSDVNEQAVPQVASASETFPANNPRPAIAATRSKIVVLKIPKKALTTYSHIKVEAKTLNEIPNLETYVVPHSGRQLRPRKGAVEPKIPAIEPAIRHSADTVQDADKKPLKAEKGATNKRKRRSKAGAGAGEQGLDPGESEPEPKKAKRKGRKTKDNPYGLTPGVTPFPEWLAPSAEQCEVVYQLLKKVHGKDVQHEAPAVIPAPSLEKTGCGEVPAVLDALLRTLLSGATTFAGAKKMLDGLKDRFGERTENGVGQGTIDWNNVRLASLEDVAKAIHIGGLSQIKAKYIKTIIDMVYQENIERREAYLKERETGEQADVFGAAEKTNGQKDLEILKTDRNILSLDHLLGLPVDEAMRQFTKYPGIGVKTSACVILFCLQRPCFAVDTHVNKFAKWLGWAPEKATEDDVFSHLEVRCPDHLKYGLHQLFIQHGQACDKCKRSTAEGTEDWKSGEECPLENLLNRFDKRQSKAKPKPPPKKKARKTDAGDAGDVEDAEDAEDGGDAGDDADPVKDEE
ncbi:amidophosphoribosyltransferase [Hypoxylon texense]